MPENAIQQARKPLFELVAELRAAQVEREMLLYPIQQWYAVMMPKIFAVVENGRVADVVRQYPPPPPWSEPIYERLRVVYDRILVLIAEIEEMKGDRAWPPTPQQVDAYRKAVGESGVLDGVIAELRRGNA